MDEITGQAANFVHPRNVKNWGLDSDKGPKNLANIWNPNLDNFLFSKNITSTKEFIEKKIIFHRKVDEITGFDGID